MPNAVSFNGREYPVYDENLQNEQVILSHLDDQQVTRSLPHAVACQFLDDYHTDTGYGWKNLISWYLEQPKGSLERALCDKVLVHLTGYSLATQIDRASTVRQKTEVS